MQSKLDLLRNYVLLKASIQVLTPADCKRISVLIRKSVNKNVSETTLKRFFGYAKAHHGFSKYTISALCEYVGKDNLNQFHHETSGNIEVEKLDKWDKLLYKSKVISTQTVENIKNQSSIPFQYTVHREFAEKDFIQFYNGDYTFCFFVSQGGLGKSIMLAHLINRFFLREDSPYKRDMLWFLSPTVLPEVEKTEFDFGSWINEQIGNTLGESIADFMARETEGERRFVVVLDGFNELAVKRGLLDKLRESLADFIFSNANNKFIKIILSMRTASWLKLYDMIRHSALVKSKWFFGTYMVPNGYSNMPLLTNKEIDSIITNFSNNKDHIGTRVREHLRYPFYIHIYYQMLLEGSDLHKFTNLTFYELVSNYVHQKINLSRFYTEKVLLLKRFINLSAKTERGNLVHKGDFLPDITAFSETYNDLIFDGILVEEKHFLGVLPQEVVRFQQTHIFEYFVFIEVIEKANRIIDVDFLLKIDREYKDSILRFNLLQWAVRYSVISGNVEALKCLITFPLAREDKKCMLAFIAEVLENKLKHTQAVFYKIKNDDTLYDAFLSEVLSLDFTDYYYKDTLVRLKNIVHPGKHKLVFTTLLAYVAFFELDMEQFRAELNDLENLEEFDDYSGISQINLLRLLYYKLTDNINVDVEVDKMLSLVNHGVVNHAKTSGKEIDMLGVISYISLSLASILYGKLNELFSAISIAYKRHPKIFLKRNGLSLYLFTVSTFLNLKVNPSYVPRMLKYIGALINRLEDESHSFSYMMMCLIMAIRNKLIGNSLQAVVYIEEGLAICELKNIHLFTAFFKNLLIYVNSDLGRSEQSVDIVHRLHNLLEEKNVERTSFLDVFQSLGVEVNYYDNAS